MSKIQVHPLLRPYYLLIAAFGVYVLLACVGVYQHDAWRDEAQAWLLARDTSLSELLRLLPSEGHPPLWYLLLRPFAKLGLPYTIINWLNAGIMIAAVYLIMFRTKLPLVVRCLIPFSYFFLFQYADIARNYCLVVFFCAAIVSLYPQRFTKPWLYTLCVVGLFNSHVLLFSFALALTLLYLVESIQEKRSTISYVYVAVMLAGGLYLIPYIALSNMSLALQSAPEDPVEQIRMAISKGLLVTDHGFLSMLLFLVLLLLLINRSKAFLLLLAGLGGILYILGYRYTGYIWHHGLIFTVFFAAYGIAGSYEEDKPVIDVKFIQYKYGLVLLSVVALLQLGDTYTSCKDNIGKHFSGARQVSAYLMQHHLEQRIIVGQQAWAASPILPYLPPKTRFYYAECQRYGTYYINDSCFTQKKWGYPTSYGFKVTYEQFKDQMDSLIFIVNTPMEAHMASYFDLLYKNPETAVQEDETFYVYKFK